jgi:uncharacterized protein (DUF58 family)
MRAWLTAPGGALIVGCVALVAAASFGSRTLGVAAVGLIGAGGIARAWAALARSGATATMRTEPPRAVEGDRVRLQLELERHSRVPVASAVVRARLGDRGEVVCRLRGHGRMLAGELSLGPMARGRIRVGDMHLELGDPLGLETVSIPLAASTALVVYPRLVELDTLFCDAGRLGTDGRRLLLRRASGFDLHSVRAYEQGESLRRVHWPTTARRGALMVKELEDSPRDTVAIVLDCDPCGAAGVAPDSSFDTAVRAAGSLLRAYTTRNRSAALVTTGADATTVSVGPRSGDLEEAMSVLAAALPDAPHALARSLGGSTGPTAVAGELVVVTASLDPATVQRLLDVAVRRLVSVVWIDAPSWNGRPTRTSTGALALSSSGIPLSVVRRGDELAVALQAPVARGAAVG